MQNVQHALLMEIAEKLFLFFFPPVLTMNLKKCVNLTEEPRNFIGLLLLNLLIIQSFKEDVQDQYVFSAEKTEEEDTQEIFFLFPSVSHTTQDGITHFLCSYISH